MFILYEAKANQAKGKILSAELFVLKLLDKLKKNINKICRNCVGTYKMAQFTAMIWHWHSIFSVISSNETDTNNFIFSANVIQKNLVEFVRYVKTQHN
jgi:hypothetical protein